MSNRPKVTEAMKLEAARLIAKDMGAKENQIEEYASCIADNMHHTDGFQIAYGMARGGFDGLTAEDVEHLDCAWSRLLMIHNEACKKWAMENNLLPPYPIGTITTQGAITGICPYGAAQYEIKPIGQDDATTGCRRRIVCFEDVVLGEG